MAKGDNGKLEESNALMANGRSKPPVKQSFTTFIYNKQEGTFLGRSAKSWVQIVVFYIIFYICLAAFWLACLAIFLKTIDPSLPRYYGKGTIIGANPGVGYQPWLKEDPESTLVRFNIQDNSSYTKYVDAMENYVQKYSNINRTRACTGTESNSEVVQDGKLTDETKEACRFDLGIFKRQGCSKENDFGYKDGKPCIIVSLNRLIGWTPVDYADGEVPKEVQGRYKKGSIAFRCDGIYDPDKEIVGPIVYIPNEGIDGRFYPYAVMDNYHQPIAMVKFNGLPKNRVVMVECRAYAKNIEQETESRLGMVTFELELQDVTPEVEENP
uniref:Sodium/potassium-transporting ATPase subunit beta n=1 Tax=Ditylenchus dipsaci TaxID=166011 RepID=A0A915EMC1_9BILA